MKYFAILLIFIGFSGIGLTPFTLFTAYADCPPNQDWSYAPCLDQTNPDLLEKEKKEWARYADVKTDRFLEIKKNEMINAIQHDVLEQWLDLRKDSKNKNVFTYYSIYDENFDSYFDLPKKDKLDGTCIIEIDLQNGMEILRNDATVSEFLQKHPEAKFTTSNAIDESYPAQTSVFFVGENEILHVRVRAWSDERCFAPAIYEVMPNSKANTDTMYFQSPLKQFKSGVPTDEIQCKENLVLIQKYDISLACVTPETKEKLIERGWTGNNIKETKNNTPDQLQGVFGNCACQERTKLNPDTMERCPQPDLDWKNSTHYIDNNSCRWVYLEKYLDENNELNFAQPYDNNGMIIDDLQRIYDWCDYSGEKHDWYFSWNNETHHIDSKQCKWYGCDDGEIYYRGVCMTPEAKEKAQSVGKLENED